MIAWDSGLSRGTLVKPERLTEAVNAGYGAGWSYARRYGSAVMWDDGDGIDVSAYISRYLDASLTIIVLSNQTRLEVEKLERQLAERFLL